MLQTTINLKNPERNWQPKKGFTTPSLRTAWYMWLLTNLAGNKSDLHYLFFIVRQSQVLVGLQQTWLL